MKRLKLDNLAMYTVVKVLLFAVTLLIVITIGLAVIVNSMSDTSDRTARQVTELKVFVDELQEETPSESQRNAAITRAVNEVPRIAAILCEQFPTASACQDG